MDKRYFAKYAAPVLMLGLLFFGCSRQSQDARTDRANGPDADSSRELRIVATVNGDPITLGEFLERLSRSGFRSDKELSYEVKKDFLNRLIEQKMMLKEAQRRRIQVGLPEINERISSLVGTQAKDIKEIISAQGIDFEQWKADIWENMMIEKLLAREVDRHVTISPTEVKRYYNEHASEFVRPEQVRARQIVVMSEGEAVAILDQLARGADFAALARQKSTAPEGANGGDLGFFAFGDMPHEFNEVFRLNPKEVSGVVKSPYGFHIFKLEERRPAGKRSLEEVYKEIESRLYQEKQEKRHRQWLNELRSRTKFEVDYDAIR